MLATARTPRTHRGPDTRTSTAYTAGAACAEGQEQRKGRIAVGFAADLAMLFQDVLTVPAAQLPATTSLLTLVDGEVIFEDALLGSPR